MTAVESDTGRPRLVVIDNYDSFTFNLVQAFLVLGVDVVVYRNDEVSAQALVGLPMDYLVLSPGPGSPAGSVPVPSMENSACAPLTDVAQDSELLADAGICAEVYELLRGALPILGVCLGHQIIAQQHGAAVVAAQRPVHGHRWSIDHDREGLFAGIEVPMTVARYHSLVVAEPGPDSALQVLARARRSAVGPGLGEVMAVAVQGERTWGVQFHPESYMTPAGERLLANFLRLGNRDRFQSLRRQRLRDQQPPTGSLQALPGDR